MQQVGHYLQIEAKKVTQDQRDLFARSAYNRYYYSVFLIARSLIQKIKPDIENLPHKSYPDVIEGSVVKELNKALRAARKTEDSALVKQLEKAKNAAFNLATQMKKANGTRITADYYPDSPVVFETSDRFSLSGIEITEAHNWSQQAGIYCQVIESAWSQVYGI